MIFWLNSAKHGKQDACRHCRTDNTGNVGAHGMHEQEVARIIRLANLLGNTRRHRNSGNAGRTDERIDFALGELAHDVSKDDAAEGSEGECDEAQNNDIKRLGI